MPELPEVETVKRQLDGLLRGKVAASYKEAGLLRWNVGPAAAEIIGRPVAAVERRGRYVLVNFGDRKVLALHLGMTGQLRVASESEPKRVHDHFELRFEGGDRLILNDARRFGGVLFIASSEDLGLGQEPLDPKFSAKDFAALIGSKIQEIKPLLMDNAVVTGIGNIYACEALFRSQIHPQTRGVDLGPKKLAELYGAVRDILTAAIDAGGSSLRNYVHVDGSRGAAVNLHQVYGKEGQPCPRCEAPIKSIVQGGRTTSFCAKCQRKYKKRGLRQKPEAPKNKG